MRLLFLVLLFLVVLIQYPLWLGKGGWFKVWDLQKQIVERHETNEGLRARNAALEAEVRNLETGVGAIEERARSELGMMREGEVFVQIVPPNSPAANSPAVNNPSSNNATANNPKPNNPRPNR